MIADTHSVLQPGVFHSWCRCSDTLRANGFGIAAATLLCADTYAFAVATATPPVGDAMAEALIKDLNTFEKEKSI